MRWLPQLPDSGVDEGPFCVTIGVFDGVHLGHQALLDKTTTLASQLQIPSLALSFDPHPTTLIAPDAVPPLLEPLARRLARLEHHGIDCVLIATFDREFAAQSAEQFAANILNRRLKSQHVIVGEDFVFGDRAQGDVALLRNFGQTHGFEVHAIAPVLMDGADDHGPSVRVSSTGIRQLIAAGEVAQAGRHLGRPFEICGAVRRGAGRGSGIGFATANLQNEGEVTPAKGVYACWAECGGVRYQALINVGTTPTFGENALSVEAHLLDFAARPLYGERLRLSFLSRLRDEMAFPNIDALIAQIAQDELAARAMFAARADAEGPSS